MTTSIPNITLTVEAQPWPKDHIARIASMRVNTNKPATRKKIQTAVVSR